MEKRSELSPAEVTTKNSPLCWKVVKSPRRTVLPVAGSFVRQTFNAPAKRTEFVAASRTRKLSATEDTNANFENRGIYPTWSIETFRAALALNVPRRTINMIHRGVIELNLLNT
jgi:hypothetical protein